MRIAAFDGEVYTRCPMGKDGTKLLPGDTVYGEDGREWKLNAIGPTFCYADEGGRSYRLRTEWLTHERPDSWERLEEDIESMLRKNLACYYYGHGQSISCLACPAHTIEKDCDEMVTCDILHRIKALAGSGEGQ